VYICQCGVPSLCDLERLEREREREREGEPKACLSYWRLSALAPGARNTCSDFAVNRRPRRPSPVYDRPYPPRRCLSLSLSDSLPRARAVRLKRKKGTRERTGHSGQRPENNSAAGENRPLETTRVSRGRERTNAADAHGTRIISAVRDK